MARKLKQILSSLAWMILIILNSCLRVAAQVPYTSLPPPTNANVCPSCLPPPTINCPPPPSPSLPTVSPPPPPPGSVYDPPPPPFIYPPPGGYWPYIPPPPGTDYYAPPPPNPILPYFPFYYKNPPPPDNYSSANGLSVRTITWLILSLTILEYLYS